MPVNKFAYRQFHSTETALLKVQSDVLRNMDNQEVVLIVMFDPGLSMVISKHLPRNHAFADDTQLYLSCKSNPDNYNQETAVRAMEDCIDDIRTWMVHHHLFIQSSKTEFIMIGSRQQLIKLSINIRVGDVNVSAVNTVNNVGSWFDMHVSMNIHVGKVCSKAFRSLYNIKQIRKYVTEVPRKSWFTNSLRPTLIIRDLTFGRRQCKRQRRLARKLKCACAHGNVDVLAERAGCHFPDLTLCQNGIYRDKRNPKIVLYTCISRFIRCLRKE